MKNILIEYDNNLLTNLSNSLYNLFLSNGYNVTLSTDENTIYPPNTFILSNKLNSNNGIEIIYSLNSNDNLAKELSEQLSKITTVSKYYQLRSNTNTATDYYDVLRYGKNNVVIKYDNQALNNNVASIIYQVINAFLNNENVYIVKSGDSLYAIAKKFNTTVDEIKRINNLTSNLLSIGQKLIVPSSQEINENIYIVKSGDTLYAIAKKFNTTVDNIKKANNLTSNTLSIGQKLTISNNQNIYIVKSGDTLYAIAKKFDTTVDNIKKKNNLTTNLLSIGQKLII